MTESEAYFILNLLSGIGPVRAKRLRERFGSLDLALTARGADLRSVEGIGPELVEQARLVERDDRSREGTQVGRGAWA